MKSIFYRIFCFALIGLISFEMIAQSETEVHAQFISEEHPSRNYVLPEADDFTPRPPATRSECCFTYYNDTGYTIQIWVDGSHMSSMAPWGGVSFCIKATWKEWYAESAGKTYFWNAEGGCRDTDWRLLPVPN